MSLAMVQNAARPVVVGPDDGELAELLVAATSARGCSLTSDIDGLRLRACNAAPTIHGLRTCEEA